MSMAVSVPVLRWAVHGARMRDADLIRNWLRNRNTLAFLGIWEHLNNIGSNPVEFDGIRIQAGLNGSSRDEANAAQLVCLANLESLNAHFIQQGLAQAERLKLLNQTAIQQMKLLLADAGTQRLEGRRP